MSFASVAIAILFGLALTVNYQIMLRVRDFHGRVHGQLYMAIAVVGPTASLLVLATQYAATGAVFAVVLTFLIQKVRRHRARKALEHYNVVRVAPLVP